MKKENKVNTRKQILFRARLIFLSVLAFAIYIAVSIFRLQNGYVEGFEINQKAQNTKIETVDGIRGNIYADDGSLLATSVPTYDLYWDSKVPALSKEYFLEKVDSISMLFARFFPEKNKEEWKTRFIGIHQQGLQYAPILKDISFDQVKRIKTWPIARRGRYRSGFIVEEKGKRMYFMGDLAKRTIGYTRNGISVGLEGAFDSLLKGRSAQIMFQRMPGRIWRPITVGDGQRAENGKDIVTTLDVRFQDITQYALNKSLVKHRAKHGCAIVMDVKTGAVKAMANLTRGKDGKYYESMNYAVDQFSEPGSTFKIISALALLEDEEIELNDTIGTHGGKVEFFGEPFEDDSHKGDIPETYSLQRAIEVSSNVAITQFVFNTYRKKPQRFLKHLYKLGLNLKPNFDIPSSNHPTITEPNSPQWSGISLPSMSIGYATRLSPLQLLTVYNSIANGGTMMSPFMVKEIRQNGKTMEKISPTVINKKICSQKTVKSLQSALRGVALRGTAQKVFENCLFPVAGKTGTARLINESGTQYSNKHMASFAGYFPANEPKYSIIVVINEPGAGNIYGAGVAAPVFREIADKIYSSHIKIQPSIIPDKGNSLPLILNGTRQDLLTISKGLNIEINKPEGEYKWVKTQSQDQQIKLNKQKINKQTVPDFRGMGARSAQTLASELGVDIQISGFGKVSMQSIRPGTRITKKTKVKLFLRP